MPEINIEAADGTRARFVLATERTTIGRSKENDICLPDQWLSRHHAEIRQKGSSYVLQDLGSKNGTLLNDARIQAERPLRPGDVITLGEHRLTFVGDTLDVLEDVAEPAGTMVFPAQWLFEERAQPPSDATELARQNRVLWTLAGAAKDFLGHRGSLPELFELILDRLFDAVPAERGAILLLEGTPQQLAVKASRSRHGEPTMRVSRSIARRVLQDRVSLLLPNLMEDVAFRSQESILSTGIRSALCAPLWFRSRSSEEDAVIGLVYLDTRGFAKPFTEDDLQVLTAIANIAAAKIENVRLLEESLEKRRLEEEMKTAAEIQTSLLPREAPRLPGYDLVGSTRPCRAVGGDYYDFDLDGTQLLLALGDVSGKGTGAALLMTVLRAAVRAHWTTEITVSEATARINRTVCQNIPSNKYITFFLARLDPQTGHLRYVNAGHNPPLLVSATGDVRKLETGGMVLGMFETTPYEEGTVRLGPGDTLTIFSDGVTETWNTQDEEFGEQRLAELLRHCGGLDAGALRETILRELDGFSSGAKATDDRTLIILKRA